MEVEKITPNLKYEETQKESCEVKVHSIEADSVNRSMGQSYRKK